MKKCILKHMPTFVIQIIPLIDIFSITLKQYLQHLHAQLSNTVIHSTAKLLGHLAVLQVEDRIFICRLHECKISLSSDQGLFGM